MHGRQSDRSKLGAKATNMANGEKAMTDKANADKMGNHFSKREIRTELGNPPTVAKVVNAIRKVPNGKALGESSIMPEALKVIAADGELICTLTGSLQEYTGRKRHHGAGSTKSDSSGRRTDMHPHWISTRILDQP
eukprot:scaffold7969_cov56-Attheya_sp.AAC.6